ncbi:MAG TPA: helix-turn-helix domain-containing protein [Anaerolineales bacterium]|nr:helix-turn-helix domain-containing protein [Anaerolineales bacterium]
MTKARPLKFEEQLSLMLWQKADYLDAYIVSRVLVLSDKDWAISDIALALTLSENEVTTTIQTFNEKGLEPFAPQQTLSF